MAGENSTDLVQRKTDNGVGGDEKFPALPIGGAVGVEATYTSLGEKVSGSKQARGVGWGMGLKPPPMVENYHRDWPEKGSTAAGGRETQNLQPLKARKIGNLWKEND